MSLLSPALPPLSGGIVIGDAEPPASPPAPSPENDDISPPSPPNVQIPPILSPPQSSVHVIIPPPLPLLPLAPPPLPPPLAPPPPNEPTPTTQPSPAQKKPNPPSVTNKPVLNIPPPTPTSSTIKANPATPAPPAQPLKQPLPRPLPHRGSRTGSEPEPEPEPKPEPSPSKPDLTRPKHIIPTGTPPPGATSSSLPTSAVLPNSAPPVALPVPQTPEGGAWMPFASETPAPLPSLPTQPGAVVNSPATPVLDNSGVGSSSQLVPPVGDHQNIVASTGSAGKSSAGSITFLPGFCVGGVLLLLLGVVFVMMVVFYKRRREKRFEGYGSGKKHAAAFSGFEDKTSLPQYSTQRSSSTQTKPTTTTPNGSNHGGEHTTAIASSPTLAISYSSGTFTYDELCRATDGFSERNLLGQGGFGYVHKGVLPNGKEVAVKQLKMGGHQGEREFRAEVETISQVHHKHLVSLVGYCIAGSERLLVYEFLPNDTMEFHLHGKDQPVMDWPTRLKIAIGAAKGLAYLHEDCSPTIIHRDIKGSNILLDFNFEAKVSDFGMAKIFTGTNSSITHITTRVVGTFGYLAPEYASSGKVTDKSDVYSYGVMLLELITGHPPICNFESATNGSLVNWARPLLAQAIGDGNFDTLADPQLEKKYNIDEMANMVACAAACVRLSAWRRPRMSQVVRTLEGNLPPSELDDGTRPGESSMRFSYESLDFDAHNYMENLKRMALTSNNGYNQ